MPRGTSQNKTFYHFCVIDNENETKKYYMTANHIKEDIGIPKSTVYNILKRNDNKNIRFYMYPFIEIQRVKIPVYEQRPINY